LQRALALAPAGGDRLLEQPIAVPVAATPSIALDIQHIQPVPRRAGNISRINALADDAFHAEAIAVFEQHGAARKSFHTRPK